MLKEEPVIESSSVTEYNGIVIESSHEIIIPNIFVLFYDTRWSDGMADMHDSKSCAARRGSSTLPPGTRQEKSKSFGSPRFARRLICIQFWG